MSFVRGYNPIWFMNNLVGDHMDDTYFAFFLENTSPFDPQSVFQDQDGNIPWSNPIEFQINSGLPDNIYFDPSLIYRIEIRQGNTQSDPLIYLVQNYSTSGGNGGSSLVEDDLIFAQNMITNPQFADINFTSPISYNSAGIYDIAPGWKLQLVGSGITTISHVASPGVSNNPGNPNYFLTFVNSGWSETKLIQTFSNNGAIFGGGACAIAFDAYSTGNVNQLTVSYFPSIGAPTTIFNSSIPTGSSVSYSQAVTLPASTNSNTGIFASVDIVFTLPPVGTISLSNIQLTGQSTPLSQGFLDDPKPPKYHEQTYERTVDQEFHVYKNSIMLQAKSNLLTGWTFPLNPWQFTNPAITNLATNGYTADQTIIVQQNIVNGGSGNNIAVGRGSSSGQGKNFVVKAVTNTNKFAMIQYIDPETISPYWSSNLSLFVKAYRTTVNSSNIRFKAKLIYNLNLPSTIGNNEPILTWLPSGEPVFASGWTSISSLNDPTYTLGDFGQDPFLFNKFSLPSLASDNMTLGIVIYTLDNMATSGTSDNIIFERVSLTPNDYAIEASVETYQESLKRCQRFYETSYQSPNEIGLLSTLGVVTYPMQLIWIEFLTPNDPMSSDINKAILYKNPFYLKYIVEKIKIPFLKFYTPEGTLGSVKASVKSASAPFYPPINPGSSPSLGSNPSFPLITEWDSFISKSSSYFYPNNANFLAWYKGDLSSPASPISINSQAFLSFHYIADSRLGI